MKKTINANIGGIVFFIDEDAYEILTTYLNDIKHGLKDTEGEKEIYDDIERRVAELFNEKLNSNRQVITSKEVQEVIAVLGQPSEFFDNSGSSHEQTQKGGSSKRMYRDSDTRIIGGVCSGLAAYWRVDPTIVRVIFILLAIFGMAGVIIYLILWIILPEAKTVAQKLEMRGEPVNLSNIGAFFRDEFENVKKSFTKK
jgi:phage shock protein PspC (stress-responsive transcriptional regulator)